MAKWLKMWVFTLVGLTIALLLWQHWGMNRVLEINHQTTFPIKPGDDRYQGGASVATVEKTDEAIVLSCQYSKKHAWPYCNFNVELGDGKKGLNLSEFDFIQLDIETQGETGREAVRIFLRNYDPAYSNFESEDVSLNELTLKPNTMQYIPNDNNNPIMLPLNNFQVASWWISELRIQPEYAAPDLTNVTMLEIATGGDMVEALNKVIVRSVQFHGKWVSHDYLQSILLKVWVLSAMLYLSVTFWQARRDVQLIRMQKKQLEKINDALKLEKKELETLATHDALTGACNRVGLRNHLHEQISLMKKHKTPLSVIFMDIDKFKEINDQYGHDVGDAVLKPFADYILNSTRNNDVLCRWGGDEFILLCHATKLEDAVLLAKKLRSGICQQSWPSGLKLSSSFGVAQMRLDEEVGEFFQRADKALYQAKRQGRDQVMPDIEQLIKSTAA